MKQGMEKSLGSVEEFQAKATRAQLTEEHSVLDLYTERLQQHRESLATGLGISLEELHMMPNPGTAETPDAAQVPVA